MNIWRSKDKGSFTDGIGVEGGGAVRFIGGLTKQLQMILQNIVDRYREIAI